MMRDPAASPFDVAAAGLARLGITLRRLPGQYRVNYRNGRDATAQTADTLEEAITLGLGLVVARDQQQATRAKRVRRCFRPRTAKAYNRWLRKKHNRRLRARAMHEEKKS
jgi:hypothetical protein